MASERGQVARWPHIVGGAILLVSVAAALLHLWRPRAKFEARVQALADAGEPTEIADIERPFVPPEQNANQWLLRAQAWLEANDPTDTRDQLWMFGDETFDPADDKVVRAYLKTVDPYLAMLARATECETAYTPLAGADPQTITSREIPALQEASQVLAALAQANPADAARCARLQFDLVERTHLHFLIGHLVQIAGRAHPIAVLQRCYASIDARAYRAIVDPVVTRALRERGRFRQAWREERTWFIWMGRHPELATELDENAYTRLNPFPFYEMIHGYLDQARAAIAAADGTPEEALVFQGGGLATRAFRMRARHAAQLRLYRVAMALLEYRQTHGAWPGTLAPLGALPQDPYTGGPFAYEQTETGVRLYVDDARAADGEALRYEFE